MCTTYVHKCKMRLVALDLRSTDLSHQLNSGMWNISWPSLPTALGGIDVENSLKSKCLTWTCSKQAILLELLSFNIKVVIIICIHNLYNEFKVQVVWLFKLQKKWKLKHLTSFYSLTNSLICQQNALVSFLKLP